MAQPERPRSDASGARRFMDGNVAPQTVEREPIAAGETEERIHPHLPHDAFYMDPEQLAERGMKGAVYACVADLVHPPGHEFAGQFVFPGDRVIVSVTPPAVADRVGPDILTKKKLARKSFDFARDASGNLVPSTEDQVFATYDRDEYLNVGKRSKKFHNDQCFQFTKGLIDRQMVTEKAEGGVFKNFDDSQLSAAKERAKAWMRNVGGVKYPTTMDVDEIEQKEGVEKIKQMERKFARGRSLSPEEHAARDAWEERQAQSQEKQGKKRTVSFPGSPTK